MKTIELICDACGSDLKTITSHAGHYLALTIECRPVAHRHWGGQVFPALLDRDMHFCSMKCLMAWWPIYSANNPIKDTIAKGAGMKC